MRHEATRSVWGALTLVLGAGVGADRAVAADACTAAEVVGCWKLTFTSPDGQERASVVTITADGGCLKGHYSGSDGARAARDLKLDRGELSFWVDGQFAGQTYTLTYRGRPRDGTIKGAVRWKYGWASGSLDFRGEKLARRVASNP